MNSATQVLDLSDRENVENYNQIINVKLEQFPVLFRRSICIHSSLQFVDLLMQNLMFSHGFTSTPVIPNQNNGVTNAPKTMIPFYKIRKEFREIFRSRHRNTLSEIAMFVGPCPVRSTYSYRVPIFVCEAEDSTHDSCGDTCGELSDVERRKINRDLFMHSLKDQNDKKMSNKNHRLFVFLKGSEDMVNEEIEEEDPPFDCKSCHEYTFVHEKCNCEGVRAMRTDGKWLRMLPFIVHSKH